MESEEVVTRTLESSVALLLIRHVDRLDGVDPKRLDDGVGIHDAPRLSSPDDTDGEGPFAYGGGVVVVVVAAVVVVVASVVVVVAPVVVVVEGFVVVVVVSVFFFAR